MSRESDKPQRIPKRRISGGAAAGQPAPAQPSDVTGGDQKPAEKLPAASSPAAAKRVVAGKAKPQAKSNSKADRRSKESILVAPSLATDQQPVELTPWQRVRRWMKTAPALSFSLILHLVAFGGLGAVTFATWQPKEELTITASAIEASEAPVEDLAEIDMGELEDFEAEDFEAEAAEMSEMVLDDVAIDAPMADAIPEVTGTAPAVATATKTADKAQAKPKQSKKGKVTGSFYGAPAAGNRFAFIVDNSNSMKNGKMLTTMDQLLTTIGAMKSKQEFYVIFYSDTAYPMFYPDSEMSWVKATKSNKAKLYDWLKTVELCSGGRLDLALKQAFALEPDSIFLVGDGSDVGKQEQQVIKDQTKLRRFAVHSLCIGGNKKGAEKLGQISDFTGGSFRFVQPLPQFVEMAKSNKFKVNKKRGSVWGRDIGR